MALVLHLNAHTRLKLKFKQLRKSRQINFAYRQTPHFQSKLGSQVASNGLSLLIVFYLP